jgi:hypothetical protein
MTYLLVSNSPNAVVHTERGVNVTHIDVVSKGDDSKVLQVLQETTQSAIRKIITIATNVSLSHVQWLLFICGFILLFFLLFLFYCGSCIIYRQIII